MDTNARGDLYFKRSNGELILLAENVNNDEAFKKIHDFLDQHNYKSYYTRTCQHGNTIHYDVGSWSEHFELKLYNEDGDTNCDTN